MLVKRKLSEVKRLKNLGSFLLYIVELWNSETRSDLGISTSVLLGVGILFESNSSNPVFEFREFGFIGWFKCGDIKQKVMLFD